MKEKTPGNDPIYKRLYAFPEMVEDLLRSLFPAETLGAVDWASLNRLPTEYVRDDLRRRRGDAVWRVELHSGDGRGDYLYILVLLEFQSTTDETMALRVLEYTTMLYRELLREDSAEPGRLPPVLPVVLYNGDSRWRAATDARELVLDAGPNLAPYQLCQRHIVLDERHASADDMRLRKLTRAVVLLEQSRTPQQLAQVAALVRDWLGSSGRAELKLAFRDWLWVLGRRLVGDGDKPAAAPPELTLEEAAMTLEERVISWREPWIRQGVEQGIRQGEARGIRKGEARGLDRERGLLRRQAKARFGADAAERLFALLAQEDDQQRLEAIGEAIVRCETAEDLLRRAEANGRRRGAAANEASGR